MLVLIIVSPHKKENLSMHAMSAFQVWDAEKLVWLPTPSPPAPF